MICVYFSWFRVLPTCEFCKCFLAFRTFSPTADLATFTFNNLLLIYALALNPAEKATKDFRFFFSPQRSFKDSLITHGVEKNCRIFITFPTFYCFLFRMSPPFLCVINNYVILDSVSSSFFFAFSRWVEINCGNNYRTFFTATFFNDSQHEFGDSFRN